VSFGKYYTPLSVEEAIDILNEYEGKARVVAGGTDLFIEDTANTKIDAMVDISMIKELRFISKEDRLIRIGALSTHTDIADSDTIKNECHFLSKAASAVGSVQIRNVGTVGGNIVNAQPAADTALALLALNPCITIVSEKGKRNMLMSDSYRLNGGSLIDPTREILLDIAFKSMDHHFENGAFMRLGKRKAMVLPVLNSSAYMRLNKDKSSIEDVRIVMAPCSRIPLRLRNTENYLINGGHSEDIFIEASKLAMDDANPRNSCFRGSSSYRKHLVGVMVFRILNQVLNNIVNEVLPFNGTN